MVVRTGATVPRLATEWGVRVRVRGLSRGEFRQLSVGRNGQEGDATAVEALALSLGLVEPRLDLAEAADLVERKSFGALETILGRIYELSGLGAGFRT